MYDVTRLAASSPPASRRRLRRPAAAASRPAGKVTLRYGLWDTNQQPVYQKCADAFEQQNPNIKIKIETQELGRLLGRPGARLHRRDRARRVHRPPGEVPAVRASQVIQPLATGHRHEPVPAGPRPAVEVAAGKQYGYPKDWDTVAIVVNEGMLKDAGSPSSSSTPRPGTRRRRHVRADRRAAERRQERQARRPTRLRPDQREDLRARLDAGGFTTARRRGPVSPAASASSCSTRTRGARSTTTTTRSSSRRSRGGGT